MLHNLPTPKTKGKSKRLGRGSSSGVGGHTVGRGMNGQKSRAGNKSPRPGFEGGQNPISRRLPKLKGQSRGNTRAAFTSKIQNVAIQLSRIEEIAIVEKINNISIETLVEFGLVRPKYNKDLNVKVLFDKDISTKLSFAGLSLSKSAKQAVEKVGGTVE